ncbi:terminase family protein [Haemophilus influenzae]|nr:terminase family protein [Haemophilus influenzae]
MGLTTNTTPRTVLYNYQKRWLQDNSRFKVAMFSRQSGKTFTTTLEIVLNCMACEARGEKTRWVILSRGERQAKEAINEGVKRHLEAVGIACQIMEVPFSPTINALEVIFPNGSKITALPANPDTARGFSANVFLDEFAFHQDSREIWKALFPVISADWKLRVVSTPNGKGNKFYELMTDLNNTEWSRHTVDIYQAVADGLPRNIEQLRKGLNDEDAWAQEFELKWLDEASSWLSYDLIDAVEHHQAGIPELYTGNPYFVGMDIAVRGDLTVIWVIELVGDVCWTREVITLKRVALREQLAELDRVFNQYHVITCYLDQTGMGEKMVEDAQYSHGKRRVQGVLFNVATKLNMATIGKNAFEDRQIRIPQGDTDLREDLHKLKKVTGSNGVPRFIAESDSKGHADRTWACFLALTAAKEGVIMPIKAQSRKPRTSRKMTQGY